MCTKNALRSLKPKRIVDSNSSTCSLTKVSFIMKFITYLFGLVLTSNHLGNYVSVWVAKHINFVNSVSGQLLALLPGVPQIWVRYITVVERARHENSLCPLSRLPYRQKFSLIVKSSACLSRGKTSQMRHMLLPFHLPQKSEQMSLSHWVIIVSTDSSSLRKESSLFAAYWINAMLFISVQLPLALFRSAR